MQTGIHFEDDMAYICDMDDNQTTEHEPDPVLGSWNRYLFRMMSKQPKSSYGIVMNKMTPEVVKEANALCKRLSIPRTNLRLLTKEQAVLGLTKVQEDPLHRGKTVLFDFADDKLAFYEISQRRQKITVEEADYTELIKDAKTPEEKDQAFLKVISRALAKGVTLTVYLCGGDFLGEWFATSESIKILCTGRRVFMGQHLYASGAAYLAGQDVFKKSDNTVIQASGMVSVKIGLNVYHHNQVVFCPIVQGGKPWFETSGEVIVLVSKKSQLIFEIRSDSDVKLDRIQMTLLGIKQKEKETRRLKISIVYISQWDCKVTVTDLGLGDVVPTTNQVWQQIIQMERGEEDE